MPALHERIADARAALIAAGIPADEAALDAELLARHVLGWDRARLLVALRDPAPGALEPAYSEAVARRVQRVPVSLITCVREFWGLDFEVSPDVLTPRPETELIVEEALALLRRDAAAVIVDVGTGSGCLAVALARDLPNARIVATDISGPALNVARRNAARHGVDDRVTFVHADVLEGVSVTADLIVSNPPYVAEADAGVLPLEVAANEPHVALFGGVDGLDVYRRLFPDAPAVLAADGRLIVEVGYDQAGPVQSLAAASGWTFERARADLQGILRTLIFRRS